MIVVAMAQHQCIEASGIDFQHRHIVEERLRLIAEVDQNVPHLVAAPGLRVHRQSPLGDQVHARRCVPAPIFPPPPPPGPPRSPFPLGSFFCFVFCAHPPPPPPPLPPL